MVRKPASLVNAIGVGAELQKGALPRLKDVNVAPRG